MKVLVATRWGRLPLEELARGFPDVTFVPLPEEGELGEVAEAEACLGAPAPQRLAALLEAAPRLRWVQTLSAGVDRYLPELAGSGDLVLTNNRGAYDVPIAEHVLALILAAAKALPVHQRDQGERRFPRGADRAAHREVRDALLVVVGLGSIGSEVARVARGVGMRVIGVRRGGSGDGSAPVERVVGPAELAAVAADADYLAVTAALTPRTRGLVSRDVIAALPERAWVVNVARGAIVDEDALYEALAARRIAGAALDAWWQEPLPADSRWWELDNVIVTPHISWSSPRVVERTYALVEDNLRRFLAGEPLRNVVDRERGY